MRFEVHWCEIAAEDAASMWRAGMRLVAIWPAPVNPDVCFAAAGFTDFEDADEPWDTEAAALLGRVIAELETIGPATLTSPPLLKPASWFPKPFVRREALPLLDQLEQPMRWDSLARCTVEFGNGAAALSTGGGHFIMWVNLPTTEPCDPELFASRVATGKSLVHTVLRWEQLIAP